jgi:hypothetical protein
MRLAVLTLLLPVAASAVSQSPAPVSQSPQQRSFTPPSITIPKPALTLSKLPPDITITSVQQLPKIFLPPGQFTQPEGGFTLDSKIVVHPPQSSLGVQAPGTLVAQDLYPGLQLLPIEESKAKGEPIPITWPNARIEPIPIVWPKAELLQVESGAKGQAPGK